MFALFRPPGHKILRTCCHESARKRLKGTFNTLREGAKRLREGGRIINFSSSVVGLLQPTYGVYAGTKAAVEAMTSILAKELRGAEHHR